MNPKHHMDNLVFVIGGVSSGKTRFAEMEGLKLPAKRIYIATAAINDDEMKTKVDIHRKSRGDNWITVEEEIELESVLASTGKDCNIVLIDCLSMFISNLICQGISGKEAIFQRVERLLITIGKLSCKVFIISNEVGYGIVPVNELARFFQDISGKVNQLISQKASSVYFLTAGIPLQIK